MTFLLACGGVAWFSFSPSTLSYWLGGVLAGVPFLQLVIDRGKRRGYGPRDYGPPDEGSDNAPWSGP